MPIAHFAGSRAIATWVSDRGVAVYEGRGSSMELPDVENWTLLPVADVQRIAMPVGEDPTHMVLLTEAGDVVTLGKNAKGQLGRGNNKDTALPDKVCSWGGAGLAVSWWRH